MKLNPTVTFAVGVLVGFGTLLTAVWLLPSSPQLAGASQVAVTVTASPEETAMLTEAKELFRKLNEQFTDIESCADGYNESALISDLQTVRSQLELYKIQHMDELPGMRDGGGFDAKLFVDQITGKTDKDGRLNPGDDSTCGPYLQAMPANPFVDDDVARVVLGGTEPCPSDGTSGWYFNYRAGWFMANDPEHRGK